MCWSQISLQVAIGFIGSILAGVLLSIFFEKRANRFQRSFQKYMITEFLIPIKENILTIATGTKKLDELLQWGENFSKTMDKLYKILKK